MGDAREVLRKLLVYLDLRGNGRAKKERASWYATLDGEREKREA
jgi:hypothetical protein